MGKRIVQLEKDRKELESFYQEHQEVLQSPISVEIKDLDKLKQEEQSLSEEINALFNEILSLEQRARTLKIRWISFRRNGTSWNFGNSRRYRG